MSLQTALTEWHRQHNAKMEDFTGWEMPILYEGIVAEHNHTRNAVSVFDICHMGEFIIHGQGAKEALQKCITNNLETLKEGRCSYGFLLNEQGGVLDDLVCYCFKPDHYMLVVNSSRTEDDFKEIGKHVPPTISFDNISDFSAKIDLQGPLSLAILERLFEQSFSDMKYFSFKVVDFVDISVIISRTGYTGELGFELYFPAVHALVIWEALLYYDEVKPAGLGARDTLRLEVGLPLYGHDLDTSHTPAEAGYGGMLTSAADYVGKEHAQTIRTALTPLFFESRRSPRQGDAVLLPSGEQVGIITSASFAPSLGYAVALAYIDAPHAHEENFVVQAAKAALPAKRGSLPFYTEGTARKKLG